MLGRIKDIAVVSVSTLGSRVLGLVRDVLTFAIFGASALNSAFLFAFTIPNLFRRLLGEGALSSALIPVFSDEVEKKSSKVAFEFLNQVVSWSVVALVGVVLIASACMGTMLFIGGMEDRWYWGAKLGIVLMPYMLFVCLAAILGAALNVLGKFGVSSLSQVWLNLAMIMFLIVGCYCFDFSPINQIYFLCVGVLVGGVIQVMLPGLQLIRLGWKIRCDFGVSESLRELFRLFIPGLAAAAIFQVNIMISRLLAFMLNDEAVSVLYLANRLIEFPLGIFTIAITTVLFPSISRCVAKEDYQGLSMAYTRGLRMVLLISIPAAVGLMILREPIIKVLFEWGKFDIQAVTLTSPILFIYALGIPFYSLATFATRGFHAFKDMKTPFYVAILVFVLNLFLSLLLMKPLGMKGLALANVLTAIIQGIILQYFFVNKDSKLALEKLFPALVKISCASGLMGLTVYYAWSSLVSLSLLNKFTNIFAVCIAVGIAVSIYFISLWVMKLDELLQIKILLKRLTRR